MITLVAENPNNGNGIVREENGMLYLLRQPISLDSKQYLQEDELVLAPQQGYDLTEKVFYGYRELQEYLLDLLDKTVRASGNPLPQEKILDEYIQTLPLPALEVYIEELQEASRIEQEESFVRLVLENIYLNPAFNEIDQDTQNIVNSIRDQMAKQDEDYLNRLFQHLPQDNAIHQKELKRNFSFAA